MNEYIKDPYDILCGAQLPLAPGLSRAGKHKLFYLGADGQKSKIDFLGFSQIPFEIIHYSAKNNNVILRATKQAGREMYIMNMKTGRVYPEFNHGASVIGFNPKTLEYQVIRIYKNRVTSQPWVFKDGKVTGHCDTVNTTRVFRIYDKNNAVATIENPPPPVLEKQPEPPQEKIVLKPRKISMEISCEYSARPISVQIAKDVATKKCDVFFNGMLKLEGLTDVRAETYLSENVLIVSGYKSNRDLYRFYDVFVSGGAHVYSGAGDEISRIKSDDTGTVLNIDFVRKESIRINAPNPVRTDAGPGFIVRTR